MASSTLSLDSLSSPSPSPSPPPNNQTPLSPHTGAPAPSPAAPFRAIDTDSELSELTDDDQDASTAAEKRAASTATASSSKGPGGPAIDDDDDTPATGSRALAARPNRLTQPQRGLPRYPNSSRRVGPGRKKRSSIVPAPMWGWVPEKTAANAAVVEEEEEEMSGPPRAMEEEEEEEEEIEEEEEGDEYDVYDHGNDSGAGEEELTIPRGFASQRRNGPYPSKRMPYGQPNPVKTRGTATRQSAGAVRRNPRKQDDDYEEEDGDDDPLKAEKRPRQAPSRRNLPKHDNGDVRLNGQDDEGSVSGGSEYLASKRKKATRSRAAASASRKRKESGNEESSGSDVPVFSRTKNGVNQPNGEHDEDNEGSASNAEDNTDSDGEAPKVASPQPLSPARLTNSKPVSVISPNTAKSSTSALSALATAANLFDPTHSPVRETSSINAAAASIVALAGGGTSSAEVPQSGNTSDIGTRHASRSRSHSPAADSDAEDSPDEAKAVKGKAKGGKPASRGSRSKTRGKPPLADKKNPPVAVNGDAPKAANPAKKGPPVPLDLKVDTSVPNVIATGQDMDIDEEANDPADDQDVDMDPSEHDNEEDDDEDGEDEVDGASAHEEDEEPEPVEEEVAEVDNDADEEAIDADDDAPDQDGDDDPDQEQENEQDAVEVEQENEEGEDGDNDDEEPSADADVDVDVEDHESDLQPAHRAEALDVLATIELKFALLRERVYVEKMDALAWEEMLVQNSAHPELQHLQKELSKRRDKRLELASRKRSYEVANAVTRRLADESNTWSWWQFSRDDLQTELIAETSRKRRKLERERRAIERPQPIRRIPHHMEVIAHPMGPPSLRKIIKAYPFGSRKQNKSDTHHHHHSHSHSHYPKNLVYPEISTLSTADIQSDIDFLAHQRRSLAYDQQHQQPPHYPSQLQRNVSGMNGMGMGRAMSMGMGMSNGALPPVPPSQSSMGPPPPGSISHQHMQQHGMGYEPYGDIAHAFGPPGAPGRVREQYGAQGAGGLLPGGPPPPGNPRDGYSNFPPGSRLAPPSHGPPMLMSGSQHHGYPNDHEMSTMAPGGPSNNGIGHQIHPNHPYFGQGSMGPGAGGSAHGPSSGHMSSHHPGSMKGGMGINGRRSMSPVHAIPNGNSGSKNGWIGGGIDAGGFHGGSSGKGGNWDVQMMHEDEERDRTMRERKRDRDEREKEKEVQRDREAERDRIRREREYDLERERHGHPHMQAAPQHRQPPPSSSHSGLSHMHSAGSASGPPPPQAQVNTHVLHNHHHHRAHHHHVVHRHHTQQGSQHASSSMPHSGGAPPIIHSPRSTREYERPLPPQGSMHVGPGQGHPTELITLSSNKREASGHWPSKNIDEPQHHPSMVEYRDRERDALNREKPERDSRKMVSGRRSTGPAMSALDDRGDRPMAMPFVMASSHTMQQTAAGMPSAHLNGSGLSSSTSSPRGAPSWNGAGALEDPSYRMSSSAPPPSGYLGSPHDAHVRSPVQGHRYASSSGSHVPPPLGRMGGNNLSSGIHHRMTSPLPQSGRARPPPSPSYAAHHSPVTSPKPRPLSPVGAGKHILSGPLPGPGYSSSPHLSGPGRASTPTGPQAHASSSLGPPPALQDAGMKNGGGPVYGGSRTASPLMASLAGAGRGMNGGGDRDRERASPRLGAPSVPLAPPPSKLGAAQMVDGH